MEILSYFYENSVVLKTVVPPRSGYGAKNTLRPGDGNRDLVIIGFGNGLAPNRRKPLPEPVMTSIANLTSRNKLRLNLNQHANVVYQHKNIFFRVNAFENVICKMSTILFRPQCVNVSFLGVSAHSLAFQWRLTRPLVPPTVHRVKSRCRPSALYVTKRSHTCAHAVASRAIAADNARYTNLTHWRSESRRNLHYNALLLRLILAVFEIHAM